MCTQSITSNMDTTIQIPAGFKEITAETRKRQLGRDVNRQMRLEKGEIIVPQVLIQSDLPVFKNENGEEYFSVRVLCASNKKPDRRIKKDLLFPYPKDRNAFLSKTQFGRDVLAFTGSEDDFIISLFDRKLVVQDVEDLDGTIWVNGVQKDAKIPCHLLEYAE